MPLLCDRPEGEGIERCSEVKVLRWLSYAIDLKEKGLKGMRSNTPGCHRGYAIDLKEKGLKGPRQLVFLLLLGYAIDLKEKGLKELSAGGDSSNFSVMRST